MTVKELDIFCQSPIKVLSSYNGRVLCRRFKCEKHTEIGKKEVLDFWADVEVGPECFSPTISPVICVYVNEFEDK